ncbi:hypothetical protein EDD18DRAFT_1466090 [Armillaria luteobubalina]|uniref:DUF6534 domain-containing protein n=1 Tax=Armillaria luteobubalina TaxID=153913 RepID=A0AA39PU30_9AGAR|nr:hypothetical protein EDD18DRAFT_1466090 [Armillaria luteobubalina]
MDSPDTASLGMTLGALYIGAMVAAILFGITNLQAFIYYKNHPDDWWVYKYAVASLWILDVLHVALSMHALYYYLITLFGNFTAIYNIVWSFKLQVLFNVVLILEVQAVYTIRLWKLSQNSYKAVLSFVILAVTADFSCGIYIVVDIYSISNFLLIERIKTSIWTVFTAAVVSDFAIAVSMCYYLHKSRSVTTFCGTSKKLLNLMRLVVISGLATSICSLLCLITVWHPFSIVPGTNIPPQFFIWPNSFIFMGIDFILPKLYVNSLLALLNSREGRKFNHGESHLMRIAPKICSGDTGEQGVNILLTETQISDQVKDNHSCQA